MKKKKQIYPHKTTLNLVIKDLPPYYYRSILLGVLIGILLISIFAKFAVIDRLYNAYSLEREALLVQARYEKMLEDNADYLDVRAEYEKYFTIAEGSENIADCMEALQLIERAIMTRASVQSAALSNNILSVVLTGINLEQASNIVNELYLSGSVSSASISSADTTIEGAYSAISMDIVLLTAAEKEAAQ